MDLLSLVVSRAGGYSIILVSHYLLYKISGVFPKDFGTNFGLILERGLLVRMRGGGEVGVSVGKIRQIRNEYEVQSYSGL